MTLIPLHVRSNLARKTDYDPLAAFRGDMDKLFENFFSSVPASQNLAAGFVDFKVNISETESAIEVRAELPGVDEKDIDVSINRDILTIRGEKKYKKEEKEKNYHLVESSYGNFARSIKLPFEAASEEISASYDKGVLEVTLAKPKKDKAEPRKIEVKTK